MAGHKYGSCVPSSRQVAGRLAREGKKPWLVTGSVKTKSGRKIKHTWVECNGRKYDNTKDQFDKYGGIVSYSPKTAFMKKDIFYKKKK